MFLVENKTEGTCLTRKNGFLPPKMNCHTVTLSQMKFFSFSTKKVAQKFEMRVIRVVSLQRHSNDMGPETRISNSDVSLT